MTQVGCTDLTVLEGSVVSGENFVSGCVTFCSSTNFSSGTAANSSFPGNACCQVRIPEETVYLNVSVSGVANKWENTKDVRCRYSFLGVIDNATVRAVSELYEPDKPRWSFMKARNVVLD